MKELRFEVRSMMQLLFIYLAPLLTPGAGAEPILSAIEALQYLEIHANPDIPDPTRMSELGFDGMGRLAAIPVDVPKEPPAFRYYLLEPEKVDVVEVGPVRREISELIFCENKICFPVQPDDVSIARLRLGFSSEPSINAKVGVVRMASRSALVGGRYFSYKSSTNRVYGHNPEKTFPSDLGRNHLAVNQRILGAKFQYGIPVPEPVFLFAGDIVVSIRDWSAFFDSNAERYYLPFFTFNTDLHGTLFSLLNGYADPQKFMIENLSFALGRAMAEWAQKFQIQLYSPHYQNFLLEVDRNMSPTGRVIFRDFGDSKVSNWLRARMEKRPLTSKSFVIEDRFRFRVHDPAVASWASSMFYDDSVKAFAAGVVQVQNQSSDEPIRGLRIARGQNMNQETPLYFMGPDESLPNLYHELKGENPDSIRESLRRHSEKPTTLAPQLVTLHELLREAIIRRAFGQTRQEQLKSRIRTIFEREKAAVLSLSGEFGSVFRSQLVWADIVDSDLWSHQAKTSVNPLEVSLIWDGVEGGSLRSNRPGSVAKNPNHVQNLVQNQSRVQEDEVSSKIRLSIVRRSIPSENPLTEKRGWLEIRSKVSKWLAANPRFSESERLVVLQFIVSGGVAGSEKDAILKLYRDAVSVTQEEREVLVTYVQRRVLEIFRDSYKHILELPISPARGLSGCETVLGS